MTTTPTTNKTAAMQTEMRITTDSLDWQISKENFNLLGH